jgi:hypothetical protein
MSVSGKERWIDEAAFLREAVRRHKGKQEITAKDLYDCYGDLIDVEFLGEAPNAAVKKAKTEILESWVLEPIRSRPLGKTPGKLVRQATKLSDSKPLADPAG